MTFSATDVKGATGTATSTVTVEADSLTATVTIASGNSQAFSHPVLLSLAASSSAAVLTSIQWDCGDGEVIVPQTLFSNPVVNNELTITGTSAIYGTTQLCVYPHAGTWIAKATVTDSMGLTAVGSVAVTALHWGTDPGPFGCYPVINGAPKYPIFNTGLPPPTTLTWLTPDVQHVWLPSVMQSRTVCVWLVAGGGTPPYTYTVTNLPLGLTVQNFTIVKETVGLLSGQIVTPGNYTNILFTVTDSKGVVAGLASRSLEVCSFEAPCNGTGN